MSESASTARRADNANALIDYMCVEIAKALKQENGTPVETVQMVRDLAMYVEVHDVKRTGTDSVSKTTTLADLAGSLEAEIIRCIDLLAAYEAIPTGAFAAGMIRAEIKRAVHAAFSEDPIEMIRAHENLKGFE